VLVPPADGPSGRDEDPAQGAGGTVDPLHDEAAGWRLLPDGPDWMDDEQWEASLAARESEDEPADPDLCPDPEDPPLPGEYDLSALIAECREIRADEARAAELAARLGTLGALGAIGAARGRRGPGQPGSAERLAGEYVSRAAGFASGMLLDVMPGCAALACFAAEAAGDDDAYDGASDDELVGAISAWDRVEAHACARKHAASAELIRRRPAPGCALAGPARMPEAWDEFTGTELSYVLAESRFAAEVILELAHDLEIKLPGTRAAFRDGILRAGKARIIADAVQMLDPAEARAAEALVLDRAGRLTPGALRSAIARAVMQVAPDKAKKRRQEAAKDARVERWAEDSGNAALVGRELPSAEVLAADQRVTWWARQLKQAGLDGTMDELRARAYLDLLLGMDSRPATPPVTSNAATDPADGDGGDDPGRPGVPPDGGGGDGPGRPDVPAPSGPLAGTVPAGFVGWVNLTVPVTALARMSDRPGEIAGIGPIDPDLARDLADAAARNPRSTWCVTVTDEDGHAIGHGCARPVPRNHSSRREKRQKPGPRGMHDPPRGNGSRTGTGNVSGTGAGDGPGFSFTPSDRSGPPGRYGTWLLRAREDQPELLVTLEPIAIDECDHRYQAQGHDPGVSLRHLTQIRHATCTGPTCRRPAAQCDFEHNTPYEAGGRTCECNGSPKCRTEHRIKQDPRWKVEQLTPAVFRWTTPAGRKYTTEPTRYPI
jgi:hypothetical protein